MSAPKLWTRGKDEWKREGAALEAAVKTEKSFAKLLGALEDTFEEISVSAGDVPTAFRDYFLDELLPRVVQTLLRRGDLGPEGVKRVTQFFVHFMHFASKHFGLPLPEMYEAVAKLFQPAMPFYGRNSDDFDDDDGNGSDVSMTNIFKFPDLPKILRVLLLQFIDISFKRLESTLVDGPPSFPTPPTSPTLAPRPASPLSDGATAAAPARRRCPPIAIRGLLAIFLKVREHLAPTLAREMAQKITDPVLHLIATITNEELKNDDRKTFADIFWVLDSVWGVQAGYASAAKPGGYTKARSEQAQLELALKFFQSQYMEKRLAGLNDIKELVKNAQGTVYAQTLTVDYMIKWLRDNRIVEQLFGADLHSELLKRSQDILNFMVDHNGLERTHLDLIWDSCQGKHESIVHIIYQLIGKLSQSLQPHDLLYVYNKINAIPPQKHDAAGTVMLLVKTFAVGAFNVMQRFPEDRKKNHLWGLDILWRLFQDGTPSPPEAAAVAHRELGPFLQWPYCYHLRLEFVKLCVKNLQDHVTVPRSLQLLKLILESFEQKSMTKRRNEVADYIRAFLSKELWLDLFFDDLTVYHAAARQAVAAAGSDRGDNWHKALVGRVSHDESIRFRLEFLEYILSHAQWPLDKVQVDKLWDCLVTHPVSSAETSEVVTFFCKINSNWNDHDDTAEVLSDEVAEYILQKLESLDPATFGLDTWKLFELYFRTVNARHNSMFLQFRDGFEVLNFEALAGLDLVWKLILLGSESVSKLATALLITSLKRVTSDLRGNVSQYRTTLIRKCMQYLGDASRDPAGPNNLLIINRSLGLLKAFLDEFEVKGVPVAGSGAAFSVNVRGQQPGNTSLTIDNVFPHDTLGSLRQRIADKAGVPDAPHYVKMIHMGKILDNDLDTISAAGVSAQRNVIQIMKRPAVDEGADLRAGLAKAVTNAAAAVLQQQQVTQASTPGAGSPSAVLSEDSYFEQLFSLLNLNDVASRVWDLIMQLPTNRNIMAAIRTLDPHQPSLSQSAALSDWRQLLDPTSTYTLLYTLQIIETLAPTGTNESPEQREWAQRFLQVGGLDHLLNVFLTGDFSGKDSKRRKCFALLLKIINCFVLVEVPEAKTVQVDAGLLFKNVQPQTLIPKLLETTFASAADVQELPEAVSGSQLVQMALAEREDAAIVKQALRMLVACCVYSPDNLRILQKSPKYETWVWTMLVDCSDSDMRTEMMRAMERIALTCTTGLSAEELPINVQLRMLLHFLPRIQPSNDNVEQYFELLAKLVEESCRGTGGGHADSYKLLLENLVTTIKAHPVTELRNLQRVDNVLIGLLNLTRVIVSFDVRFKLDAGSRERRGLIDEVFRRGLFDIATADNHGPTAPPKCKTKPAREAAFRLLLELSRDCTENFRELADLMQRLHSSIDDKRLNWFYLPTTFEKSQTGYVGLKNLGATCYMNSLMQQFFMIQPFRHGLFSAALPDEPCSPGPSSSDEASALATVGAAAAAETSPLAENMLFQLQSMLANLQESEKKYFDTRDFCKSYKQDGEPVNPLVQMDADEYFNMLFDKLETALKGSPQEKILKEHFGGMLCNQVISKECPHVSEREEGFYTLRLEIKGKKSLLESLNLYIEGDMLEGQNKYHCSVCSQKVDALKRTCIKELPSTLIVHLKRFEYDLEQMKRIKVNDYCEFPMSLNMEGYTKEGLEAREHPERPPSEVRDPRYYRYELTGILVHTGTADSGHYYSFIKERVPQSGAKERKWYHFNDTEVEVFDPNEIQKTCFGGTELVWQYDAVTGKQMQRPVYRNYSAYMLFYERERLETEPAPRLSPEEESRLVPGRIFKGIWEENMHFLREKNVFSVDYFRFVESIVSLWDHRPSVLEPVPVYYKPVHREDAAQSVCEDDAGNFDAALRAIELGTRFLFVPFAHSKDRTEFANLGNKLYALLSKHIPACQWFLRWAVADPSFIKSALLVCTVPETREVLARIICHVVQLLHRLPIEQTLYFETEPVDTMETDGPRKRQSKSLVIRFMDTIIEMIPEAAFHWHHFPQFFFVLREFAACGALERQHLMRCELIAKLVDFFLGDDSPAARFESKKRPKMGDKHGVPPLGYMFECLSMLVRSSKLTPTQTLMPPNALIDGEPLVLSPTDFDFIRSRPFWQLALKNATSVKAVADIAAHLAFEDAAFTGELIAIVTQGIKNENNDKFRPYFQVLEALLLLTDSLHERRIHDGLSELLLVMRAGTESFPQDTCRCLEFVRAVVRAEPAAKQYMFQKAPGWLLDFLLNSNEFVRRETVWLINDLFEGEYKPMTAAMLDDQPTSEPPNDPLAPDTAERVRRFYTDLVQFYMSSNSQTSLAMQCYRSNDLPAIRSEFLDPRLKEYIRLLKYFCRGADELTVFYDTWAEFAEFWREANAPDIRCDENRRELTEYLLHAIRHSPSIVDRLVKDEDFSTHLLNFNVTVHPGNERYKLYNRLALPPFYTIVLICARHSEQFLKQGVCSHGNFEWGLHHLYFNDRDYPTIAVLLYEILKLATQYPTYRRSTVNKMLEQRDMPQRITRHPLNFARWLDLVLIGEEEYWYFSRTPLFDHILAYLANPGSVAVAEQEDDDETAVSMLLTTFQRMFEYFCKRPDTQRQVDMRKFFMQNKRPDKLLAVLFNLLRTSPYPLNAELADKAADLVLVVSSVDASILIFAFDRCKKPLQSYELQQQQQQQQQQQIDDDMDDSDDALYATQQPRAPPKPDSRFLELTISICKEALTVFGANVQSFQAIVDVAMMAVLEGFTYESLVNPIVVLVSQLWNYSNEECRAAVQRYPRLAELLSRLLSANLADEQSATVALARDIIPTVKHQRTYDEPLWTQFLEQRKEQSATLHKRVQEYLAAGSVEKAKESLRTAVGVLRSVALALLAVPEFRQHVRREVFAWPELDADVLDASLRTEYKQLLQEAFPAS